MNTMKLKKYSNKNITVVTGINGSGKSRWLIEQIQKNENHSIIATTTVEHKYSQFAKKKNCNLLIPHSLYYNINSFITDFFRLKIETFNSKREALSNYLEYIGFTTKIIIQITNISDIYITIGLSKDNKRNDKKREILAKFDNDDRIYIDLREKNSDENLANVIELFKMFGGNRHSGLKIKYLFERNSELVSLNELSSGEINLFRIMCYFLLNIRENSSLYIDEPENSLHPKWQYEFIGQLINSTYTFKPQIYIATHSPIILAGLFEDKDYNNEKEHSIENILYDYFDLIFPDSNVLPEILSENISNFTKNIQTKDKIIENLTSVKDKTYTDKQKNIINLISNKLTNND